MELWLCLSQGKLVGEYLAALLRGSKGARYLSAYPVESRNLSQTDQDQIRDHNVEQLLPIE